MDVKSVLVKARALCETHWSHWDGFGRKDEDGNIMSCCVVGAITAAATKGVELAPIFIETDPVKNLVEDAVETYGSCLDLTERSEVEDWNDERDRTREEVVAVFDCAISKVTNG